MTDHTPAVQVSEPRSSRLGYWSADELAAFLGVSRWTIQRRVKADPSFGPGDDTRRWDQEELAAIQREVDRVSRAQATNRRDGDDVDRRLAEFKRRRLEQGRDSDGE
jgi:hypothetical protein